MDRLAVESSRPPFPGPRPATGRVLGEALGVSAVVTVVVAALSAYVATRYVATAVGFVFLGATWLLVWRSDDERVRRFGLALGGLVLPGSLDMRATLLAAGRAFGWALGFALLTFVPFYLGWRAWWAPKLSFHLALAPGDALNEVLGQVVVIALPEEAFYRGYLQSRLDEAWGARLRVLGARVGPGLIVASVIFAAGHYATIPTPARLAVFFPSLVFGWLRARTGGIGAGLAFHALCNIFSEMLGRGYGVY